VKPRKRAKINGDLRKKGRESMEIGGRKRVAAHREERELKRNKKKKRFSQVYVLFCFSFEKKNNNHVWWVTHG
jgi:hypothetical protein